MTDHNPTSRTATVNRLREMWIALLELSDIGPESDFFDEGGDSLTGGVLMSLVCAEFRVDFGLNDLFDHSTVYALAAHIDRHAA